MLRSAVLGTVLAVFILLALIVPAIALSVFNKGSVVERLRKIE
ncbi:hypothetical protein [Faecalicatena faecalis]|nr:hypothetical protein [Faecalicatena faecalis]